MTLNILTPTVSLTGLEVSSVCLPGSAGSFEVLHNHAPLLSSLEKGKIVWDGEKGKDSFEISSGFVDVKDNVINVVAQV